MPATRWLDVRSMVRISILVSYSVTMSSTLYHPSHVRTGVHVCILLVRGEGWIVFKGFRTHQPDESSVIRLDVRIAEL